MTAIAAPARTTNIDIAASIDIDISGTSVVTPPNIDVIAIDIKIASINYICAIASPIKGAIPTTVKITIASAIDIAITPRIKIAITAPIDPATIFAVSVHIIAIGGLAIDSIT